MLREHLCSVFGTPGRFFQSRHSRTESTQEEEQGEEWGLLVWLVWPTPFKRILNDLRQTHYGEVGMLFYMSDNFNCLFHILEIP